MGLFKNLFEDTCKGYDKVKTNKKLTYEELYEVIKDGDFKGAKPEIQGNGIMKCIKFPPVNKYVIQIAITGETITISKIYSGAGGMLKEGLGNAFTGGWYDVANKENIDLNRLTRDIGEEISKLIEEKGLLKK